MEKKVVLCDTNILIEVYKGNIDVIERLTDLGQNNLAISDVTAGELMYGARDKNELKIIRGDLKKLINLPITSEISNLAMELVAKYCLSHKLALPDALIAATSIFYSLELYTLNKKDFVFIEGLKLF